ncbi:hypothetical protein MMC08_003805 [Hypocenomyce scalaris]|nr:hypothetical protein [Hypocenomyce scalaris]
MGAEAPPQAEKQKRVPRPNYNQIHALPLPLNTFPLPPLVPHNPLSLFQIAYTYISQLLAPPSSHTLVRYQAYFSPETRSVHVVDEQAIRVLWERGFFGKGSLSRSEPSWLDREKRRKGLLIGETSEEVTRRRREERREFKKDRARKEREAIEEKLQQENKSKTSYEKPLLAEVNGLTLERANADGTIDTTTTFEATCNGSATGHQTHSAAPQSGANALADSDRNGGVSELAQTYSMVESATTRAMMDPVVAPAPVADPSAGRIYNQEHLQLSFEEAFFLVYGIGVLEIRNQSSMEALTAASLFSLFRQYSYFPPASVDSLQPDDPFLTSYIVYHHFRSLGWVVRPGVKFAVNYLLYNRGPVFSHAEFAVIILPSYSDSYWASTAERRMETRKKESKSWWWLHCVNRVQSQVRKSLVLVYVEIPPPVPPAPSITSSANAEADDKVRLGYANISQLLKRYKVRELTLKRWIPNRSRD